ncbi:MAG: type VI secretion system baseplate subunit TssF [Planctomycetes bacterium]|nr:type VI secretion system baseplate subunit TssF [Planctomycetota bacterium]
MFNKYYQDELSFLREMGREFSRAHPEAAPFLAERGSDPDVERLLEGFSFLTARIRQKLDDEFPEFTHALIQLLWPHYLRPLPSMSILQFEQLPQALKEPHLVPRGSEVLSVPVDGTPCRFRTVTDVPIAPLVQEGVDLKLEAPPYLRMKFRIPEGVQLKKTPLTSLRLYLHGEPVVTRALYLCLLHNLKRLVLRAVEGGPSVALGPDCVRPAGFGPDESLLPTPPTTLEGFRLLLEYFAFPLKFLFVELAGLEKLSQLGDLRTFDATFELSRLPDPMPPLGTSGILLNCTPVVNLFRHEADPIRIDRARTEYKVRPAGSDAAHYEIYGVDKVSGLIKGVAKPREYRPFLGFAHSLGVAGEDAFYKTRLEQAIGAEGTDVYISFSGSGPPSEDSEEELETVTLELTCTNRQLPSRLRLGDISVAGPTSPAMAKFRNITMVTPSVTPPMGGDLTWRLLSHMALNYLSLSRIEALRSIVGLYNFRALVDRQAEQAHRLLLDGLRRIESKPTTRFVRGMPMRGTAIDLELSEDHFAGEGDLFLFGTFLDRFFETYVSINSFTHLTVKGTKYGGIYTWPPRLGGRTLM